MTDREKARGNALAEVELMIELDFVQAANRRGCIIHCVERLRRRVPRIAMALGETRFLLLQVRTVGQQQLAKLASRRSAVDLSAEPIAHKTRKISGVIDVGVGQ